MAQLRFSRFGTELLHDLNAGHLPPLLFPAAQLGVVHKLASGSPALGLLGGLEY